jgi:integrase
VLAHFTHRKRAYHAFAFTAFWTGIRPSELVGLRWGDIDLRTGKLSVRRSRTLGEDNATKTRGSERTIDVAPAIAEVLRAAKPLHVTDDDFVFLNPEGKPIDVKVFTQWTWNPALRRADIRPRRFYATRHTFISAALARDVNIKFLADYCGTSVQMIEQRYGRYLRGDALGQLARLGDPKAGTLPGTLGTPRTKSPKLLAKLNGEGGIRTLGRGLSPYTRLAGVHLRPLGHLSIGSSEVV